MSVVARSLSTRQQFKFVVTLFIVFVVIELLNILTNRSLNQFGNIPRHVVSLPGIFISPFLHGSVMHFLSNILPLCIFSFFMLQYGTKRFLSASLFIILVTGLLVWILGRSAVHVGVSGVVYGYFGFLILAGFLSGQVKLIGISLLVGFFYGGLIFGVLPTRPFVSWESHLFGFVAGLLAARIWAKPKIT